NYRISLGGKELPDLSVPDHSSIPVGPGLLRSTPARQKPARWGPRPCSRPSGRRSGRRAEKRITLNFTPCSLRFSPFLFIFQPRYNRSLHEEVLGFRLRAGSSGAFGFTAASTRTGRAACRWWVPSEQRLALNTRREAASSRYASHGVGNFARW